MEERPATTAVLPVKGAQGESKGMGSPRVFWGTEGIYLLDTLSNFTPS